jgi:hypothetical protein
VEKDLVSNYDFSIEKLPGTEYGLIRNKTDQMSDSPKYCRYPSNVQWDPDDTRLLALEIYLFQHKLDLSADFNINDVPLTSRAVGNNDSNSTGTLLKRDSMPIHSEDTVS